MILLCVHHSWTDQQFNLAQFLDGLIVILFSVVSSPLLELQFTSSALPLIPLLLQYYNIVIL